jgi:DNA-directed RNA polymerase specialized sigma subunit
MSESFDEIKKQMESRPYENYEAVCTTDNEKEIAKLLFVDGLKAQEVADIVGYCERQIYRIKKKLKERMQNNERS